LSAMAPAGTLASRAGLEAGEGEFTAASS